MGCHVILASLRVAHRSEVLGRFLRKLLIRWDEDSVSGAPTMEDVAQRNCCVTVVHIEKRHEVTLPTRARVVSPNRPRTAVQGGWITGMRPQ